MDLDELKDEFEQRFNCSAKCIVRCPGRVNLIGIFSKKKIYYFTKLQTTSHIYFLEKF